MYKQLPEWGHCPGTATENVTKLKALLLRQRNVQDKQQLHHKLQSGAQQSAACPAMQSALPLPPCQLEQMEEHQHEEICECGPQPHREGEDATLIC